MTNEVQRLAVLHSLGILDTPAEERFDRITRTAARLFDVPIALIGLVDANRQWFKSCVGLSVSETPRNLSFCAHAILGAWVLTSHAIAEGQTKSQSIEGVWQAVEVTIPGASPRTFTIPEPAPNLTVLTARHYSHVHVDAVGPDR